MVTSTVRHPVEIEKKRVERIQSYEVNARTLP